MIRTILSLFIAFIACFAMPSTTMATPEIEIVENNFQQITITYSNAVLRVTGAEGEMLQVYNVAGVKVLNIKVDGDDKRYEVSLPKGCYIVKIGKFVRKISVK